MPPRFECVDTQNRCRLLIERLRRQRWLLRQAVPPVHSPCHWQRRAWYGDNRRDCLSWARLRRQSPKAKRRFRFATRHLREHTAEGDFRAVSERLCAASRAASRAQKPDSGVDRLTDPAAFTGIQKARIAERHLDNAIYGQMLSLRLPLSQHRDGRRKSAS